MVLQPIHCEARRGFLYIDQIPYWYRCVLQKCGVGSHRVYKIQYIVEKGAGLV